MYKYPYFYLKHKETARTVDTLKPVAINLTRIYS